MSERSQKGRLLGLDYGSVRIGLAVSDPDRLVASPLATYTRRSERQDAAYFAKIVAEVEAVAIVVGLPLHSDGQESDSSRAARAFADWLKMTLGLPVALWDERFTTDIAEEALLGAKLTPRERKERRDRVAAQIMLQSYLEAGCPVEPPAPSE